MLLHMAAFTLHSSWWLAREGWPCRGQIQDLLKTDIICDIYGQMWWDYTGSEEERKREVGYSQQEGSAMQWWLWSQVTSKRLLSLGNLRRCFSPFFYWTWKVWKVKLNPFSFVSFSLSFLSIYYSLNPVVWRPDTPPQVCHSQLLNPLSFNPSILWLSLIFFFLSLAFLAF